jgi:hypothetical protein
LNPRPFTYAKIDAKRLNCAVSKLSEERQLAGGNSQIIPLERIVS